MLPSLRPLGADVSNIDYKFIEIAEGFKPTGHWPGGNSGVTIGMGVDLKSKNRKYFEGLPKNLIDKLEPYFGKSGKAAKDIADNLVLTESEARQVTEHTKEKELQPLKKKFEKDSGISFDDLPTSIATPIASVAFQYGISSPESKYPSFWNAATNLNIEDMEAELRDFKDKTPSINVRHEAFADYLAGEQKSENVRRLRPDFISGMERTQVGMVPMSAPETAYAEPKPRPQLASDIVELTGVPRNKPKVPESEDSDTGSLLAGLRDAISSFFSEDAPSGYLDSTDDSRKLSQADQEQFSNLMNRLTLQGK